MLRERLITAWKFLRAKVLITQQDYSPDVNVFQELTNHKLDRTEFKEWLKNHHPEQGSTIINTLLLRTSESGWWNHSFAAPLAHKWVQELDHQRRTHHYQLIHTKLSEWTKLINKVKTY